MVACLISLSISSTHRSFKLIGATKKEFHKGGSEYPDKRLKKVDTFEGETISKKEVKNAFVQKYQVNPTKVEIGYENDQFVYCLTYKGKDTLLYAFYSLDNGEFLKAYKL